MRRGQQLLVMNAMKMEHVIAAPATGIVRRIAVAPGDTLFEDEPLLFIEEPRPPTKAAAGRGARSTSTRIRPDLAEVLRRRAIARCDAARPAAVARAAARGQRTARENIDAPLRPRHASSSTARSSSPARACAAARGTDAVRPGRRHGRRASGHVNGDLFDRDALALRRAGLRLHGARRHAGRHEPPQEGPHVRGRRAAAAPVVLLHRGRRRAGRGRQPTRAAGRRQQPSERHGRRGRSGHADLEPARAAERAGAAGRHHLAAAASPATPRCSAAAT